LLDDQADAVGQSPLFIWAFDEQIPVMSPQPFIDVNSGEDVRLLARKLIVGGDGRVGRPCLGFLSTQPARGYDTAELRRLWLSTARRTSRVGQVVLDATGRWSYESEIMAALQPSWQIPPIGKLRSRSSHYRALKYTHYGYSENVANVSK
jgi:hypothetical protein